MQFPPSYNKNTAWIPHSPPTVTPFICSKTLKVLSLLAVSTSFSPIPSYPLYTGSPPHTHNYSTKTAIMKITHGFCISKSKVSSQISSYLSYHHHLTLLIPPSPLIPSLASRTPDTLVSPSAPLAPPSQPPLLIPLLLLVLLIEFFRVFLHIDSILWLLHPPHRFNYLYMPKNSKLISLLQTSLSFSKPNLIYSTFHSNWVDILNSV